MEVLVHPEQKAQWVQIKEWVSPYPDDDHDLERVREELAKRLEAQSARLAETE